MELILPLLKLSFPFFVKMLKLLLLHLIVSQLHIYGHSLYMWWLLYDLLVLLQDLLQLGMLLHDSLILKANSVMLMLLPMCSSSL